MFVNIDTTIKLKKFISLDWFLSSNRCNFICEGTLNPNELYNKIKIEKSYFLSQSTLVAEFIFAKKERSNFYMIYLKKHLAVASLQI